ncbi:type II toxin-antitoxin system RelE/ParE family toxin [Frigoriflavimonas asaccharolytica]|uniref:Plasmid stabilization system protein ParE n=1 Tax=Frigoriflavimonas asaccharolytica TaxID=2735899 RepID=A0A8J8G7I7_9FLAO|nr:type II toxin-antitoxin system RelE/ParE family toxin [Frigoriflavimonas asaccharolytica]NRS92739.1 plasmid stabilization system protein ParE [Frigoriflavimonas asaccharolytica]
MFTVKWTPEAEEQYYKNLDFWIENNKSSTYSEKIIEEVIYMESLLIANPLIGIIVENTNNEVRRVLILTNFALYYRLKNEVIEILTFWGNKMNPKDLKF